MATLTEAAYYTRRAIKYGAVGLVIIIVARIGFGIFATLWKAANPPAPLPPTVAFGKLPPLPLPPQEKPPLTFTLETVTGTTGVFDPLATVYLVPAARGSLLALERATELAEKMDFLFEPVRIGETLYRWTKDKPLPSSLEVDLFTNHFTFDANWRVQPQLLSEAQALSEVDAIAEARSWLSGLRLSPEDLEAGEVNVTYLKVSGTDVVPALSQSEAQFVRVDLFRSNLEERDEEEVVVKEFRILPLDPSQGVVSVLLLKRSRARAQVIHAEYRYLPVEYEQSGTYPLITSQSAWERLQKGDAYYAVIPENRDRIAIRRITLDYLDPPAAGIFLQPIFVFEGDVGFTAYVPAVSEEQILESQ